ncbi:MAG: ABC transporter ATP-binding protein [Oscillospiraceae bacterium]|nr:ABC transporter ATP-binding protein [Oscillospiraceae bacterium]
MIVAKQLTKQYGSKTALDGVSFSIEKGELVGLLGLNGAGKTTLMNILAGCLSPTHGAVEIGGYDIARRPKEAKSMIGYLQEQPAFYGDMRVDEYLGFICDIKKTHMDRAERAAHISDICRRVGVGDVARRVIRNLSKGYRQRVGFAQALIGGPSALFLDEPTAGLDPSQIVGIRSLVSELSKTCTVFISSHILSEIQNMCNRVIVLSDGHVVADAALGSLGMGIGRGSDLCQGAGAGLAVEQGMGQDAEQSTGQGGSLGSMTGTGCPRRLVLRIKGDAGDIERALRGSADNRSFDAKRLSQPTPGMWDFEAISIDGSDFREHVFRALAAAGLPLLQTFGGQNELEDIFLELVQKHSRAVEH